MLDRAGILSLIPHAGGSCLLHEAVRWSDTELRAHARSHLDPCNPLRRDGQLNPVCGAEYGLQAAALHGALRVGGRQRVGYLVALREVEIEAARLDDPAHGTLVVDVALEAGDAGGSVYRFHLSTEQGRSIVRGRGTVALEPAA